MGTKAWKIGENTLVVGVGSSSECREGLGEEKGSTQLCRSRPFAIW